MSDLFLKLEEIFIEQPHGHSIFSTIIKFSFLDYSAVTPVIQV
nr:MAG TPA: hypothetical protein [Caudoviricetes sp.]